MSESVTIHDVAAEAQVSIATVSRVLNNIGSVKESTKERVYRAARTVGYPLPDTETSAKPRSKTILVMCTNIGNMYTGKEVDGILSAAHYSGYDCVIYKQKSEIYSFEHIKEVAESVNACGILISWPNVPADILTKLSESYPVVQFSEYAENCNIPYVSIDDVAVGKMATNYLLKLGYRRIGIMNGVRRYKYARDRERGYLEALKEFGLEADPSLDIAISAAQLEAVYATANQLLALPDPPEAVVAASDIQAAALIRAVSAMGKSVPEDIAVISCEDTDLAQCVTPTLTSVSHPIFHIGEQACSMLISIINGHRVSPDQINLNVELVVREST